MAGPASTAQASLSVCRSKQWPCAREERGEIVQQQAATTDLKTEVATPLHPLQQYATESARPLVSMAFVAPLLAVYELGAVVFGPHVLRNGADIWLRHLLGAIGFGQYFLLPLLTCGALLGWHHMRRDQWSLNSNALPTMLLESTLLAMLLLAIAHLQRALFVPPVAIPCQVGSVAATGTLGRLVGYCGAGIYEELLFRLIMLPAVARLLGWLGLAHRARWAWAVLGTSLIFSAAHYQLLSAAGYAFDWYSFSFRFVAGLFFAVLFVFRGFGIAAGAHTMYDILVEIL